MKAKRFPLLIVTAALLLVGCASTDEQRTQTEGAAAGALIGGVLGYMIDGKRGALIGAAVGAGTGLVVGNEVAKRKQAYVRTEDFLDAEIARVDEFNRTASAYNSRARQDLARLELETDDLRRQYDQGVASRTALANKRAELETHIATNRNLEQTLAQELEVQLAILKQESPTRPKDDTYIARLEAEVQALEANLEALRQGGSELARIDQRLSV